MLRGLWHRLTGRSADLERSGASSAERRAADEGFEDRQADLESEAHLGGFDPARLLPGDEPHDR